MLTDLQSEWFALLGGLSTLWDLLKPHLREITDAIIALFTIVLAVATIQLARATNVLADDTRNNAQQREIQNALSAAHSLVSNMAKAARDNELYGDMSERGISREALGALSECEAVAIGVRHGLYDMTVLSSFDRAIAAQFERVRPTIELLRARAGSPAIYSELEWLSAAIKMDVQKI